MNAMNFSSPGTDQRPTLQDLQLLINCLLLSLKHLGAAKMAGVRDQHRKSDGNPPVTMESYGCFRMFQVVRD